MDALLDRVSQMYDTCDKNRERTERSIALMVEELDERHRDLQAREAEMSLQNQHFKDALASLGGGLAMYDANGRLIVCNDQYVRMYQLGKFGPKPGSTFEELIDYRNKSGVFKNLVVEEYSEGSPPKAGKRLHETCDGRWIEVTLFLLGSGGWVTLHEDVTEREKNIALREAAVKEAQFRREQELRAESENKAKSEFLATMSHEIRTPLNAVLGLATTLLETSLAPEQRLAVEAIDQSGGHLLRLLNDILDFSKLEAGRMEFEKLPFSPLSLAENAMSVASARAEEKNLNLVVDIDERMPESLVGDAGRIGQVLLNLVTNALKFTDRGEVTIGARLLERLEEHARVEFYVRDTGMGIPADRIGRLFGRYAQADSSVARRYGGTGLGLAICKLIVTQMGGEIGVLSRQGEGSTFAFQLTLPVGAQVPVERIDPASSAEDLKALLAKLDRPFRLLVAEDNPTNQLVLRRMLAEFSLSLLMAGNGYEAIGGAQQFAPDMIFMDMQMPEMDGLEATRAIRALGGAFERIPIVALTANAFADDIRACRDAGMSDFLAKPVRKKTLAGAIARVVSSLTNQPAPATQATAAMPAPSCGEAELIDAAGLAELAEEIGDDGVEATLAVYFQETDERLQRISQLRRDSDRESLRVEAHTLKGASSTFGFRLLQALAFKLEQSVPVIDARSHAAISAELNLTFRRTCEELARHRKLKSCIPKAA